MKNRIFLLLLCVLAVSVMTADDSLYFPEGSRWTNASSEASYIIQGDTLVNGKKYHKVIDKNKDHQKLVALKREEGKKIYVRFEGTDTDVLLYDFGLEVGDSIVLQTDRCNGPCSINHVERIDTVTLLDGRKAKCFFYDSRMWDVEFVGCETGLFGPIYMPVIPTMYSSDSYSYCFSINGKPIFETYPGICKSCGFTDKLPSLCDEWNVLEISNVGCGYCEKYRTYNSRLTTDTVIGGLLYSRLIEDGAYKGALREGTNRDIFYIPSGSTHEYLLYNFNAKVGDKLTNLWYGGDPERCPNGYNATVLSISDETPRVFTVEVEYIISDSQGEHIIPWLIYWTEGVGLSDGPAGQFCPGPECTCSCGQLLLCAYKNGEQVYVSKMGEQYGCEYNYNPDSTPSDTIPLFIKDGPGSSTVEPVDPNLIYATLTKDVLSVYAKEKTEISFVLYKAPKTNQVPATKHTMKSASFTGSLSTTLTESGTYTMELTSPAWGYTVFGTFEYKVPQAIENTSANAPSATKILRDGQLLLMYQEQMFNVQGQRIK